MKIERVTRTYIPILSGIAQRQTKHYLTIAQISASQIQLEFEIVTAKPIPYALTAFNQSKFSMRGAISATISDTILVFDITGPFYEEFRESIAQYRTKILNEWRPNAPIGVMSTVRKSI